MNKKLLATIFVTSIVTTLSQNVYADTLSHKTLNGIAIKSNIDIKNSLKSLNKDFSKYYKHYQIIDQDKDNLGYTHYTLVPKKENKEALNKQMKIHVNPQGKIVFINGDMTATPLTTTNIVNITTQEAIDTAFKSININPYEAKTLTGRSPVARAEVAINTEKKLNVYDIQLIFTEPTPSNWKIQIDAETGDVLSSENLIQEALVKTRGIGVFDESKILEVEYINGLYQLANFSNPTKIEILDDKNSINIRAKITDEDRIFRDKNQRAGVDALIHINKVYDYYKKVHNRESYDNNAAPIKGIVHHKQYYNNAAWTGEAMIFGDGDGYTYTSTSGSLDVVAHELTHAVTSATAKLNYSFQSGALNESMSDVFAYFIEPNWDLGERVYTPMKNTDAIRNMKTPSLYGQPEHMDDFKVTSGDKAGDYGSVHANSGIPNKAFYNVIEVEKLEVEKAEKIYYRALTKYMVPTTNFSEAKAILMQTASELYSDVEAQKFKRAFDAVGIK